jgi:hypothetical protein
MTRDKGPLDTDATSMRARTVCGHTGLKQNTGSMMTGPYASLGQHLEELLEVASFSPPADFVEPAKVTDASVYDAAVGAQAWRCAQARQWLDWAGPFARSRKIMRRLLRDVTDGDELDEVSTLGDPTVMTTLKSRIAVDGGGRAPWTSY